MIQEQQKMQKKNLEQSNPFKNRIQEIEISNAFKLQNAQDQQQKLFEKDEKKSQQTKNKSQNDQKNPFKIRIHQFRTSNPFKLNFAGENQIIRKDHVNKQKIAEQNNRNTLSAKKQEKQKQMENSNPFKINFANNNAGLFFGNQNTNMSGDVFENIIKADPKQQSMHHLFVPKLKTESKNESTHMEQNIKKYKELLSYFYNENYHERVRKFQQQSKRGKRQGKTSIELLHEELAKKQVIFKANRLSFNRQNKIKTSLYQRLEQYYLASYIARKKQIAIYELKQPNLKSVKPIVIQNYEQNIANSIQYDPTYGRIFYFSNARQQIVVIGVKAKQVICRVKIKQKRINPLLYINKFKNNLYLFVIGGYKIRSDHVVQGSKFIQIFSIDKWQISLKQVILRLSIGRISPIIFSCDHQNEACIFIIGGSSNALIDGRKQIILTKDEDINFSTNQTGIRIGLSFIEECFSTDQSNNLLLINNVNVRFNNPLNLFGGTVLNRRMVKVQKMQLFLPKKRQIYTIKLIKNDVHIIQSQLILGELPYVQQDGAINKTISYHRDIKNSYQLFTIMNDGFLMPMVVFFNPNKSSKADQNNTPQCKIV